MGVSCAPPRGTGGVIWRCTLRTVRLERQLTSGAWQVTAVYGFDADERAAIVQANRGNLRQRHLFRVDLESGEMTALGKPGGGVHSALLAPGGAFLVDTWSALDMPPRADVARQ